MNLIELLSTDFECAKQLITSLNPKGKTSIETTPYPDLRPYEFKTNGVSLIHNNYERGAIIKSVLYNESEKMTCYQIKEKDESTTAYAISFNFSGCGMALFLYNNYYYATHITTSSNPTAKNGKDTWKNFIEQNPNMECCFFLPHVIVKENIEGENLFDFANMELANIRSTEPIGIIKISGSAIECFAGGHIQSTTYNGFCFWQISPRKGIDCANNWGEDDYNPVLCDFEKDIVITDRKPSGGCRC
ncbi:MAG: hypothetical protein RRX93_01205 [Bacteroidales bacterium]